MLICRECRPLYYIERPSSLRLQYEELGMFRLCHNISELVKSCVVTVKTVSIVCLFFGISLIAVPS